MKILSIPLMHHDTSVTILENGKIIDYMMEERFSRLKHDFKCNKILDILIKKNINFNYIFFIPPNHKNTLNPDKIEKVQKKIKLIGTNNLIELEEKHHLYHAYSGFYNSNFDESLCFIFDGAGCVINNNIEICSIYYMNKFGEEKVIYKKFLTISEGENITDKLFENGGQSVGI